MKTVKSQSNSQSDAKPENYKINAKICRLVERFPTMYDRSHPQYLKKDVVDKAWVKIAKEMDDSISSCKERWRNIRTSFARSINVHRIPASANRTKPYYLHEELLFLGRHITPGVPVSRRSNASNVSYYSAGEESEAIEVSVGGESFDGFATLIKGDGDDEDDDDDDISDHTGAEEEEESHDNLSSMDDGGTEHAAAPLAQPKREVPEQITKSPMPQLSLVETPELAPVISMAQIMPPKKRQRIDMNLSPAALLADLETEPEIQHNESNNEGSFDASFLKGLLPEMKAMDFRQKLLFKRRIYEVISEVFESANKPTPAAAAIALAAANIIPNNHPQQTSIPQPNNNASRIVTAHLVAPSSASNVTPTATHTAAATMTVVSAADLAMIRRLNNLLQNPTAAIATLSSGGAINVASNNILGAANVATSNALVAKALQSLATNTGTGVGAALRSTTAPITAPITTVTVNRGALARTGNSANLLRVTMVNPPVSTMLAATAVAPTATDMISPNSIISDKNIVKQEPIALPD